MFNTIKKYINTYEHEEFERFLQRFLSGEDVTLILCGSGCSGKSFLRSILTQHNYLFLARIPRIHVVSTSGGGNLRCEDSSCVVVNLRKIEHPKFEIYEKFIKDCPTIMKEFDEFRHSQQTVKVVSAD